LPGQSPLFHALNADRYDRQSLIEAYEAEYDCALIVMIDAIFPESITLFEELIYDADPAQDLHLLLHSPGGDGETAVRLVRSAQSRCRELTVIVPDRAKSAATLLALGAHRILMSATSDLGPVDPQLRIRSQMRGERMVAAKDLLAAYQTAMAAVAQNPNSYPIQANLLADIDAVILQFAQSAMDRTGQLVQESLKSNPDRNAKDVEELYKRLHAPLIEELSSHGAVFGAKDAAEVGLPVEEVAPSCPQWQLIWRLWTKYFPMSTAGFQIYEGRRASQIAPPQAQPQ
jgi:hypothetical protein